MADTSTTQPGPSAAPRAERRCDGCGQTDDKPHHQVVVPGDDGLQVISRHFGCCAASDEGCPDDSCAQILNGS